MIHACDIFGLIEPKQREAAVPGHPNTGGLHPIVGVHQRQDDIRALFVIPLEKTMGVPVVGDHRRHAVGRGGIGGFDELHGLPAVADAFIVVRGDAQPDASITESGEVAPRGAQHVVLIHGYTMQGGSEQGVSAAGGGEMLPREAFDGSVIEKRGEHDAADALGMENAAEAFGRHARGVEAELLQSVAEFGGLFGGAAKHVAGAGVGSPAADGRVGSQPGERFQAGEAALAQVAHEFGDRGVWAITELVRHGADAHAGFGGDTAFATQGAGHGHFAYAGGAGEVGQGHS